MEDSQAFSRQLEERLDAKRDTLDRVELPKLRDTFKLFQAAFVGLSAVLHKKGVLHDDPYKYELKISDVKTPSESPFSESEKATRSAYASPSSRPTWNSSTITINSAAISCTMGRVKRLLSLVKYFNFSQFTETTTQLNTRALAEIAGMVKKGSDQLLGRPHRRFGGPARQGEPRHPRLPQGAHRLPQGALQARAPPDRHAGPRR